MGKDIWHSKQCVLCIKIFKENRFLWTPITIVTVYCIYISPLFFFCICTKHGLQHCAWAREKRHIYAVACVNISKAGICIKSFALHYVLLRILRILSLQIRVFCRPRFLVLIIRNENHVTKFWAERKCIYCRVTRLNLKSWKFSV